MSNKLPDDKDGLLELLKKLWLPIAGFLGAVMLAYNFYKLWSGDQTIVTYIVGGAGLLVLIIALGWVGFKSKTLEVDSILREENQTVAKKSITQPAYAPRYRRSARVALSLVLFGVVWIGYSLNQRRQVEQADQQSRATQQAQAARTQSALQAQGTKQASQTQQAIATQNSQAAQQAIQTQQVQATQYAQATAQTQQELKSQLIVVIATFDGPEEVYGLRNEIIENLSAAFSQDDEIKIRAVGNIVTPDMGSSYARNLGEQYFADLVIWGWYRPTENPNLTLHIENLSPIQIESLQPSETYRPQATLTQLESFELQRQIGSDTKTLISFLIGTIKLKSGDYQTAIKNFEAILSQSDRSTFINRFALFYNLGYLYNNIGSYELSVQNWDQAIEIDPEHATAHNNRGYSYYRLGEYERAIQDFSKAIEIDPKLSLAYSNRGFVYHSLGDNERAIEDYNKAIELDPTYADAYLNRGQAYVDLEQYERAIKDCDKAIELDPNLAAAYSNRGVAYSALDQQARAIEDFNTAINLDATFSAAYNGRGVAKARLEQYEQAIKDFNLAIQLDSDEAVYYNNRGLTYKHLEQYEPAIENYNKAIQYDPNFALAYRNRGQLYQMLGRTAEAEADFKKYEELTGEKP